MELPAIYDNNRRFIFTNWTKSQFLGKVGGIETLVKPGQSIELPMFTAYLFCKQIVDIQMIEDHKEGSMSSEEARAPYELKTIAEISAGVDSPAMAQLKEQIKEEIEIEKGSKEATKKKASKKIEKKEEKEDEENPIFKQ